MSANQSPGVHCPRCDLELPPEAAGGLCPACAFGETLAGPSAPGGTDRLSLEDIPVPDREMAASEDARGMKPDLPSWPRRKFRNKPGDLIGRYKLLEKIGEGGCGVVYVAEQEQPVRRRVALKVIKLGMDTREVIARFEAERQALAMMEHPNIAKVLDAGATDTGRPYFVMELVKGVRITDYCDRNNLATTERLGLFIQICHAVQHAHQKGIIHRDLKPSNILVTRHDGVPVPKVIDFGIAKSTTNQRLTDKTVYTAIEQFIGTPAYMSPEQAELRGLDIDTRSDIYALGVLLYELLTGQMPFDAKRLIAAGLDEIRRIIREEEPPRPSTRISTLTDLEQTAIATSRHSDPPKLLDIIQGDLDWIVMKTLEKDRTRRYETANGLALDIQRYLGNEPVLARPPSAAYRFQKAVRRNKLVFAAATAVALALVVGLGLAGVGLRQALKERNTARVAQAKEAQLRREAGVQELATRRRAYASDMNLAQQAIALNNFGRAQELLDRYRPATKTEIDLRGWEWCYLWQFCQSDDLFTLCRKENTIWSLPVSPDGRYLAVGEAQNGRLSVWDLRARQQIAHPSAEGQEVFATFSPREPLLAFSTVARRGSTNWDYEGHLWDVTTRKFVASLPLAGRCFGLKFAADGRTLATATRGPQGAVTLWSVPDGRLLASHPVSDLGPLVEFVNETCFAASPDLQVCAYPISGGRFRVAELNTGREPWVAKAVDESVQTLEFSPDGKILATGPGYEQGVIQLWEVASGREIGRLEGHSSWIGGFAFWPDGKTLASASADQTIRLWDLSDPAKGRALAVFRGHNCGVTGVTLLPDIVTLVSGGKDGTVRFWDTKMIRRRPPVTTLPANLYLGEWCFASDSESIITLDGSGRLARWQGNDFQESRPLWQINRTPTSAHLAPGGLRVAAGFSNGVVRVWDIEHRPIVGDLAAQTGPVVPWVFLPRSNRLIVRHEDRSLHEWDLSTGRETTSWQAPRDLTVGGWSPDERWFAAFGYSGESVWRDRSTLTQTNLGIIMEEPSGVSFSPDGTLFSVVSWSGIGKVWSFNPLQELATLQGFLHSVYSVAFFPDGKRLVVASGGKEAIKLWDTASYQELLTLEAQGAEYDATAVSPDGNVIGSRNRAGFLTLWRAPSWAEIEAADAERKRTGER